MKRLLATLLTLFLAPNVLADLPKVALETSQGRMVLELNPDKAPKTVANFLEYVRSGHYDDTIFHRVIAGFMIQGGGYDQDLKKRDTRAPIANEADNGLLNERGAVAMARTGNPHSATAQFFINHRTNPFLDYRGKSPRGWGYAVFGRLVEGEEVLDAIARSPVGRQGPLNDVPKQPITILTATVLP